MGKFFLLIPLDHVYMEKEEMTLFPVKLSFSK